MDYILECFNKMYRDYWINKLCNMWMGIHFILKNLIRLCIPKVDSVEIMQELDKILSAHEKELGL